MSKLQQERISIFIAYSRKDWEYSERLRTYLKPLEKSENLHIWYDGEIVSGTEWEEAIKTHLNEADIILLLISADSLAADYFYENELKDALTRHNEKKAVVIPVILKHCGWQLLTELNQLQALPKDAKPITSWNDESAAYNSILEGVYENVKLINNRRIHGVKLEKKINTKNFVTTNCKTFEDSSDPKQAMKVHVLYRDYVKMRQYEDAFPLWLKAYTSAPEK